MTFLPVINKHSPTSNNNKYLHLLSLLLARWWLLPRLSSRVRQTLRVKPNKSPRCWVTVTDSESKCALPNWSLHESCNATVQLVLSSEAYPPLFRSVCDGFHSHAFQLNILVPSKKHRRFFFFSSSPTWARGVGGGDWIVVSLRRLFILSSTLQFLPCFQILIVPVPIASRGRDYAEWKVHYITILVLLRGCPHSPLQWCHGKQRSKFPRLCKHCRKQTRTTADGTWPKSSF